MIEPIDMTEYLLDTWAWIEFYIGSEKGEEIYELIESDDECYTSVVSLAELSDNFESGNLKADSRWEEIRGFVESKTEVVSLDGDVCGAAGKIKNEERKEFPDFGLMDAVILTTARKHDLKIVTGDRHLKDRERAAKLDAD